MSGPTTLLSCSSCGQRLRIPSNRGELLVHCPKCRHESNWTGALSVSQSVNSALALLKSGNSEDVAKGKSILKELYDNREWIGNNVWKGIKLINAIAMVILMPERIGDAADALGEFAE